MAGPRYGSGARIRPDAPESADRPIDAPKRSGRLVDLAMAGGSFALAIGGVILPGVPTLPFVIMTGRYAVRVSPRIERLLTRQPWCAAMLAEAETSAGPGFDWRSLAKTIGPAVLFVAAFLILHPPLPVVLALELGLMAYMAWREMGKPGLSELGLGSAALRKTLSPTDQFREIGGSPWRSSGHGRLFDEGPRDDFPQIILVHFVSLEKQIDDFSLRLRPRFDHAGRAHRLLGLSRILPFFR